VQLALAKHVHVNVVDRLATQFVAIHHDAETVLATQLFCQALGGEEDMAGDGREGWPLKGSKVRTAVSA